MKEASRPRLLVLAGPTASGKTDVALALAKLTPVEIISSDSMQVYKGMPIVSQAPSAALARRGPIRLVSFLDPTKEYSAAQFRADAVKAIQSAEKRGKIPLISGGTGLYIRALLDGLFEAEGNDFRDEAYRKKLLEGQEKHGGDWLHQKLTKIDSVSAAKIHPNDFRRLVRALEVPHLTGKPISALKPARQGLRATHDVRFFFLDRDRAELYERINCRVEKMKKAGLVPEVKRLLKKKLSMTASVALGIKEIKSYLKGECTLDEALEILKMNTRRYAKRQLSWFRHEKGIELITVLSEETSLQTAKKILGVMGV